MGTYYINYTHIIVARYRIGVTKGGRICVGLRHQEISVHHGGEGVPESTVVGMYIRLLHILIAQEAVI